MIEYGLYKNHLTAGPNDYSARVQNLKVADEAAILQEMIVPGGVTKAQAAAVMAARSVAIEKILLGGRGVHTDFCKIKHTVRGVFNSEDDSFDESRHILAFVANPRKKISKLTRDIKLTKVRVGKRIPLVDRFIDTATQMRDEVMSIGKVGEIKGIDLKCDLSDNTQGVFIIKADGSEVQCVSFLHNTASKIMFYIPETLTVGEEIELEVRNKLNDTINDVRIAKFPIILSVV